jgi:hypothetical protein
MWRIPDAGYKMYSKEVTVGGGWRWDATLLNN